MPSRVNFDYDLIVIGSGAAGSSAAIIAARAGKRVAIVESGTFGGESPNYGDIPTKALLHAAHLYDEAKHGARFGIRSTMLGYNFVSLQNWKELAIKRTGAAGNRAYYEKQGISVFNSPAHFLSPNEISINRRHLSAEQFLIATGSHWEMPEIVGLSSIKFLTPKTILDVTRPPKTMFVVGGGSIAVELAQLMATFGTKVYIAERAARILPREDQEVGALMERLLHEEKGISVLTQARVLSVQKDGMGKRVTYGRGGTEKSIHVDEVLVTVGRQPNVDLGLENASVSYTPSGIEVNEYLQTSAKHIYAAGDVLGQFGYTQSALLEGRIAGHNLTSRQKATPDHTGAPRVTFTFPGIASVGLSEDDCLKRDLSVSKAIAPLNMIARSNTSDFRDGFVKLIADKKGMIIGATVVAPHAAEIIGELALTVKHGLSARQVADTPHSFLSWSDAIRVAASKLI